jgi:hypothetical protein
MTGDGLEVGGWGGEEEIDIIFFAVVTQTYEKLWDLLHFCLYLV